MHKTVKLAAFLLSLLMIFAVIPAPVQTEAAGNVVYASGSGSDSYSGKTASSPFKTLAAAFNSLGSAGGTVVICGAVEVNADTTTCSGSVTVTSVYNGIDYRQKNGASLTVYKNITMAGALKFENIKIIAAAKSSEHPYKSISMKGYALHMGEGIECALGGVCKTYLSIVGGAGNQQLTIESGDWQRVRGNDGTGSSGGYLNTTIKVTGGTFHEKLILTGEKAKRYVNVNATIDGGAFLGGIYLVAFEKDAVFGTDQKYYGNVNITVNDGAIYGPLSLSFRRLGAFYGNCTLNLNGGELHRITEICGPKALGGTMTSTLNFGPEVNASAKVTGSETFDFQLCAAADPFVFYHDGMYYMTSTGGDSIGLSCVANLSDLGDAAKTTIFKTSSYKNAWSPEIHYFSDEEIGAGNGGWYLFLGLANTEDTDHSGQREYVLKCLDGDYLLGRWGDPITGEVNKPRAIEFTYSNSDGENYNKIFCAGMSILRVDGEVYMTFVSEVGRGTSAFHQTINIVEFETPWNITGKPVVICKPDYSWEMNGYSTDGTKWWPKVVEGCSPVYGEDGSTYLMYTGSGYWTTWYALGYMKLVGTDPMNPASWQKNPTPILQRKSTLTSKTVNGCGHGSYFTDSEGKMWVCYHGYVGTNTDSGRFAFLEPIYVSNSGVSIGGAGINPPDAGHTQTEPLNSTPIADRADGFAIMDEAPRFKSASLTLQNNIAINFKVRNFDSLRYTNVRVEFEMAGKTTVVNEGVPNNDLLVFSFKNLSPAFMTETVTAKLYATYDGQEYEFDCKEYSIATYCYNQLATDAVSQNTVLRTMLVDLLNYGSESQLYTNRNTDKLANAQLTEEQRAWATQTVPTYTSVLSFSDAPDVEKAVWKSASLYMQDNIQIRFKLQAESVEGLNAIITLDGRTWIVPAESFNLVGGVYVISFDKLVATQLSEKVEITICEGVVPVSKTLTYSVETYAANTEESDKHYALVNAMMKYGNAAMVYVDSSK